MGEGVAAWRDLGGHGRQREQALTSMPRRPTHCAGAGSGGRAEEGNSRAARAARGLMIRVGHEPASRRRADAADSESPCGSPVRSRAGPGPPRSSLDEPPGSPTARGGGSLRSPLVELVARRPTTGQGLPRSSPAANRIARAAARPTDAAR